MWSIRSRASYFIFVCTCPWFVNVMHSEWMIRTTQTRMCSTQQIVKYDWVCKFVCLFSTPPAEWFLLLINVLIENIISRPFQPHSGNTWNSSQHPEWSVISATVRIHQSSNKTPASGATFNLAKASGSVRAKRSVVWPHTNASPTPKQTKHSTHSSHSAHTLTHEYSHARTMSKNKILHPRVDNEIIEIKSKVRPAFNTEQHKHLRAHMCACVCIVWLELRSNVSENYVNYIRLMDANSPNYASLCDGAYFEWSYCFVFGPAGRMGWNGMQMHVLQHTKSISFQFLSPTMQLLAGREVCLCVFVCLLVRGAHRNAIAQLVLELCSTKCMLVNGECIPFTIERAFVHVSLECVCARIVQQHYAHGNRAQLSHMCVVGFVDFNYAFEIFVGVDDSYRAWINISCYQQIK